MIFDKYLRTYCGGTYYMTHCRQKYRLASLEPVDKLCTYYTSIDSNQGTNLQKGHSSSQNVRNVLPKTLSIWALPFSGWIPAKETGYTNRSQSITLGMGRVVRAHGEEKFRIGTDQQKSLEPTDGSAGSIHVDSQGSCEDWERSMETSSRFLAPFQCSVSTSQMRLSCNLVPRRPWERGCQLSYGGSASEGVKASGLTTNYDYCLWPEDRWKTLINK